MLWNLRIENIAVVKELEISFREGFTVITGQTGAGKSILVDSLLLLCGGKNARELVRTGEERASVSAIFGCSSSASDSLSSLGYPPDENSEIELQRIIQADGRSSAKINRRTVPVSALRDVSAVLLSIQTQNERSEYADQSTYTALLDSFADDGEELAAYRAQYESLCEIRRQISELKAAMNQRELMLSMLKFQKKEIDAARLGADDEEEKLVRLRNKLKSMERVAKYSDTVTRALAFSEKGVTAAYLMERAQNALSQISDVVEGADDMVSRLESYRYEIIDMAERVQSTLDGEDIANPAEKLTQIETRLSLLEKLRKKYGDSIAAIKAKRDEITAQIADLEDGDFRLTELEKQRAAVEEAASREADKLREKRVAAGAALTENVIGSLRYLDMPKIRFRISVLPVHEKDGTPAFRPDGCDDVDFLISVNAGEEMQSLGKVSSGGELSRITLAMKTAFAEKAQVIAITHSPQIASLADCHLLIEKHESDGRTESSVREIAGEERAAEIARIIGGISVTEKQTAAAREMLTNKHESNL